MPLLSTEKFPKRAPQGVFLPLSRFFDPAQTLDCGQAFRWEIHPDGSFSGVAGKKICHISQLDGGILFGGVTMEDFYGFWEDYFDLKRDYAVLQDCMSADPVLARAIRYAPGLRLLRQEPWEALCSFIISQNNNIPRIKGIIRRMCEAFGEPLGEDTYAFPGPDRLARLSIEDLAPLRAGFRARYLIDAACKVAQGQVCLEALRSMPLEEARAKLMEITGVGVKVADCTLLYGCGRMECFPADVWIKRAMAALFPDGLPSCAAQWPGIAQQYLFHYIRTCPEAQDARDKCLSK